MILLYFLCHDFPDSSKKQITQTSTINGPIIFIYFLIAQALFISTSTMKEYEKKKKKRKIIF